MQSTKEEYHFTRDSFPPQQSSSISQQLQQEALLLQQQKRLLSSQDTGRAYLVDNAHKLSMRNFQTGSEKVLVVLLVASATVCCLTNLLVYLILTLSTRSAYNRGKRVKLVLRYQLMKNQALTGLLTTAIVIYPLRILATSFEHHQHQAGNHQIASIGNFTSNVAGYHWSNEWSCLLMFTMPLIGGPFMSLGHSVALYAELILRKLSYQRHMVLVASQKLIQKALWSLLAAPLALALLSALPSMSSMNSAICYRPWSITYWYVIMAVMASLTAFLTMAILLYWIRRRRKPLKTDSTNLVSTYHSAKYAGCDYRKKGNNASEENNATTNPNKATMMVHTVDPPPFLDISLPSATVLNFFINVLLFLPSLVHLRPRPSEFHESPIKDSFMLWTHVLVLIAGSVTPVLHLMTDEALSSLGLDLLHRRSHNLCCCPAAICDKFCARQRQDQGHDNEACSDESL